MKKMVMIALSLMVSGLLLSGCYSTACSNDQPVYKDQSVK